MLFSVYKKPFEEEILQWAEKLKRMSEVVEEWSKCQGQYMYLQPIFDSADIAKQLPGETKKFKQVDKVWKEGMQTIGRNAKVTAVCVTEGLLENLQESNR